MVTEAPPKLTKGPEQRISGERILRTARKAANHFDHKVAPFEIEPIDYIPRAHDQKCKDAHR